MKGVTKKQISHFSSNPLSVRLQDTDQYGHKKYAVILHEDTEDGGYWIECPELPGCVSQGDTVEETLDMIKDAVEVHLEILEEDKKAVRVKKAV